MVGLLTLEHGVPGSNPSRGGIHLITVWCFITQSLSLSPFHHHDNDLNYLMLNGT